MKISEIQQWLENIKQASGDVEVGLVDFSGYMDFHEFEHKVNNSQVIIDLTRWDD